LYFSDTKNSVIRVGNLKFRLLIPYQRRNTMKHATYYISHLLCISLCFLTLTTSQAFSADIQSWDKKINQGHKRFKVLSRFADQAVLDKETQLVWMTEPLGATTWSNARFLCAGTKTGNRMGWRLPSLSEFTSLLDPNNFGPALSNNHPFIGVTSSIFWTATVSTGSIAPLTTWAVDVTQGQVHFAVSINSFRRTWCVRGQGSLASY
jgi:hypothetical protein